MHHPAAPGRRRQALRFGLLILLFLLAYAVIAGRMVQLHLLSEPVAQSQLEDDPLQPPPPSGIQKVRADITDRNGLLLATSLPRPSLCADGRVIKSPEAAAMQLLTVLPDLDLEATAERMSRPRACTFIARGLTRDEQYAVNALGLVGLDFKSEYWRSYPQGEQAAHLVGFANIDNRGMAGVELALDGYLVRSQEPVALSIDLRVQAIINEELARTAQTFDAIGAAAVMMDVQTGEVLSLNSWPTFDPNDPGAALDSSRFNRATHGVYELGSVMKLVTAAAALDSGAVRMEDGFDASKPIYVDGRFTISDFLGQNRWLTVPEIIKYSSNIGAARMAIAMGTDTQQRYLRELGLLSPASIQVPEVGKPGYPAIWRPVNTMTISYGHGLSVSPLQMVTATAALVNGGILHSPTLLRRSGPPTDSHRVIREETSKLIREMMRGVVLEGSGKSANSPDYLIGGKTGTAAQPGNSDDRVVSLLSAFPIDKPRFVLLLSFENPVPKEEISPYATGGVIAARATRRIVERIAPLVGLPPQSGRTQ